MLEIWNNLFNKGLKMHSSFFYHMCFFFFEFSNKSKFDTISLNLKFTYANIWSLEWFFTKTLRISSVLVFVSELFEFSKSSKYEQYRARSV
jgi:hypothetical protein